MGLSTIIVGKVLHHCVFFFISIIFFIILVWMYMFFGLNLQHMKVSYRCYEPEIIA